MHKQRVVVRERSGEKGFTLIEALIAMVILVVGIAAVSNLMIVAGSSNSVANHTTSAAAIAAQQMELLKSSSFPTLVPGGTLVIPAAHGNGHPLCNTGAVTAVYNCDARVNGVGTVHVQWQITGPLAAAGAPNTHFIQVVAQPVAAGIGLRGRASFTTFRTN